MQGSTLTTAWVGDSRMVLGRQKKKGWRSGWEAIDLSTDHKPTTPEERARILDNHGRVERCACPITHPHGVPPAAGSSQHRAPAGPAGAATSTPTSSVLQGALRAWRPVQRRPFTSLSPPFVMFCPVRRLSCPVLPCLALPCHVLPVVCCPSCPVLSCPIVSCPVLPCPALSYRALSCPALSRQISRQLSCRLVDETGQPLGPYRVWLECAWLPGLAMSRALGDRLAHS